MQLEEHPSEAPPQSTRLIGRLVGLSLLCAMILVVILVAYSGNPTPVVFGAVQVMASAAAILGAAAFVLGVRLLLRANRSNRRPIIFISVLTIGIFLAHMYIVNSPPAYTTSTLSGTVNSHFSDSQLNVTSTLTGVKLVVRISDAGSSAIQSLTLSVDNVQLPSSNLSPRVTPLSPLQPVASAGQIFPTDTSGIFVVQANSSSTLSVTYQPLNCYHVPQPGDQRGVFGCIMDETYYVPSAMGILAGTQCAPYADSCNLEHPPLAKALIAGGIAVFGIDTLGWRISNVILGTLTVPLLFALALVLSKNNRLSYMATLIFAADTLFFVHSSAALIDVPSVFFSVMAFVLYVWQKKFWKFNNYEAAGIAFGLAALSKETAIFALVAVVSYEFIFGEGGRVASLRRTAIMVSLAVVVFIVGVQLYDSVFASAALPWFYQQVSFMLNYGAGLRCGTGVCGWSDVNLGRSITPLDWLAFYTPVSYLVTRVTVTVTGAVTSSLTYVSIGYFGTTNQVIVWMVFLWVPLAIYRLIRIRRWATTPGPEERFAFFFLVLFLWSYVPYLFLWMYGRVTYPFYILPAAPALAAGAAYFLTRDWFPRKMAIVYLLGAFAIFFLFFPVKDFLPGYLRAILGH